MKNQTSPRFRLAVLATLVQASVTTGALAQAGTLPNLPAFRTSAVDAVTPHFQLAAKLPQVPAQVPLMATFVADDPLGHLSEIARSLGLDGKLERNGKGKLATRIQGDTEDQQTLTGFEASGGFFYRYDHKLHAVPEEQPRLPENEKAFAIATEFLQKHGLLPDDALVKPEAVSFHQPTLTEFDGKSGSALRSFSTSIEVRYPQQWGDLPVTGPGSKLYVSLGDGGEVVGVTRMWRSAKPTDVMLTTVPAEEAFRELKIGPNLSVPIGCATARIEQFELAYWSESPKESQRTSLPLYQIDGTCLSERGEDLGGFTGYAPAVLPSDFKLNDAPRKQDDVDDEGEH